MTIRLRGSSRLSRALFVLVATLTACVGSVENFIPGSSSGNPSDPANPTNPDNPGNPQVAMICTTPGVTTPLAVPLQRITDVQYASIIGELFASKVSVQTTFPAPIKGYLYSTYSAANPMQEGQTQAVLDTAEAVAMQVADIVPACSSTTASAETSCATTYLKTLATRAFRRPATTEEMTLITGAYTKARPTLSYGESVAVGVEMILQMPQFLYVLETQPTTSTAAPTTLSGAEIAQRMAMLYWNGLPDQMLLDAAQSGDLADPMNRLAHADRMLKDPRAKVVFRDFLLEWMGVKGFRAEVHAADVQSALEESMRRDIDFALANASGLQELVSSRKTFVNSVLEKFYGLPAQSSSATDWRQIEMDPEQRVGVLTSPLLLAKFAHGQSGSPILRGKFVRVMMMCDEIGSPPPGAQAAQDALTGTGSTIREQSQARLDNASCGSCHKWMDPIGFGFSAFDGVGKYVPTVGGQPVDMLGHIESTSDLAGDFQGVRALGDKLAKSPKVQACMAAQWLRYAFGTKETAVDQCTVQALVDRFSQQDNSLTALFAGISGVDSFSHRRAVTEGSP